MFGDIGPWACAGMTGGRVYIRVNPEWNLDREALSAHALKSATAYFYEATEIDIGR